MTSKFKDIIDYQYGINHTTMRIDPSQGIEGEIAGLQKKIRREAFIGIIYQKSREIYNLSEFISV